MRSFFLIILLLIISALMANIRALWVPIWEITSVEKIDLMMEELRGKNLNQLLVQIRYRGDAAYIPNKMDSTYFNPEKPSFYKTTIL